MKNIEIKLIEKSDIDKLFVFERENRLYFESIGLPRNPRYYDRVSFEEICDDLIKEQGQGVHYIYLIINLNGYIVGRVNLTDVIPFPLKKAELGYRISEEYQGYGYGTIAVKKVLQRALSVHDLHRIEAGTSPQNLASQGVLLKNGFRFVGIYNQYICSGDEWIDSMLYEKILI